MATSLSAHHPRRQMMPLREEEDGNKHGHFAVCNDNTGHIPAFID